MLVDALFESRSNFGIGDPVIITGNVEYRGKTGDVREVGRDGSFVVVDLYNYGPYSFHASDVRLNDYADSDEEDERAQGVAESSNAKTIKPVTPAAKRYHEKHKWLLNGNIPGAAKEHYNMIQKLNQKSVAEGNHLGNILPWPEVVNKINSAMRATGWKSQRKDDNSFLFSTKGQLDDEFYIVIIDNQGNDMFTYAIGTVEEGDPHIGERDTLPNTDAGISELTTAITQGFGMTENVKESENPYGYKVGQTVKLSNGKQGRVLDIFNDSIEVLMPNGRTVTVDFRDAEVLSEQGAAAPTIPGRGVDAKGRTQAQWVALVKKKFPSAKVMIAKMQDGPAQAVLPDGRKLSWSKVEQTVAEGWKDEADDYAEWSNYVKQKLSQASPAQRLGLAKKLSQIEIKNFGSTIQNGFNKETGKPQIGGLGLTDTIRSILKSITTSQAADHEGVPGNFSMPFGSVSVQGMENATPEELAVMKKAVMMGPEVAGAAGKFYREHGTITDQDLANIQNKFDQQSGIEWGKPMYSSPEAQANREQSARADMTESTEQMTPNWAKYVLDQLYNSNGDVTMTDLFDEGIPGLRAMFMDTAQEHGLDPDEDFMDVEHEVIVKLENFVKGGHELDEGEKIGNMPADKFDTAMARLKHLAGAGPLKTVWDPQKRVYKNMPTAVQPKK